MSVFFRFSPLLRENVSVALKSIISNRLRSILTIIIIAIGITSLTGILTAIDAFTGNIEKSFEQMGTSSFEISRLYYSTRNADRENKGRNFTGNEISSGTFVCIMGDDVAKRLFKGESPLERVVTISGVRFQVIGVPQSVGATFGGGTDNSVIIPIQCARGYFIGQNTSFNIGVKPSGTLTGMNALYDKAEQLFRSIRRLSPADESDFRLSKNDALISDFKQITDTVTAIAVVIGLITLLGAAVGLMNIMLISVKERIAEIGTRRAIGASARMIKQQFLLESVIISEVGCVIGVIAGVLIGNAIAMVMGASFVIPYFRIVFAVVLCIAVGVFSGYIPAVRASKLDPIESLRHE